MKKLTIALLSVLSMAAGFRQVVAQNRPPVQIQPPLQVEKTEQEKFTERVRTGQAINAPIIGPRSHPSTPKGESRVVKEGLLAPSAQDRADHQSFLSQPNTGLIRLLPREVYDSQTYRTPQRISRRGGGAYYSFLYKSHEYGSGSDIQLEYNLLSTGFAGADFGFLTILGEVPLTALTADDARVTYLATYSPPHNEPGARVEQQRSAKGFVVSGMQYRRLVPVVVGSTYLLRSVVYGTSDVLVAFTVTRKDTDGSAIIIWKRLKKYSVPKLN